MTTFKKLISVLIFSILTYNIMAQNIQLPQAQTSGGKPLNDCLQNRKSTKEFNATKTLSLQEISNVLWAAYGKNRADKRTVPSAMNCQEFTLYVFLPQGVYRWNDVNNELVFVQSGDKRSHCGPQDYVAEAGMNIVYVADYNKMGSIAAESRSNMAYADCGFMAQNVYLQCESLGIGCVIRGYIDRKAVEKELQLPANQHIILTQSVGYKK